MIHEEPLIGWKEIARYLGMPLSTLEKRIKRDLESSGVVMRRVMMPKGVNGRRMPKNVRVWTWPSLLQRWAMDRGKL